MKTQNNTSFPVQEIEKFPVLGKTVNKWRQRNITLYAHPSNPDRLISVGITFDGTRTIICDEEKKQWTVALEYASLGKVYVSE